MFLNIIHSITVFNEHFFDVREDSSKCEKHLCLAGMRPHKLQKAQSYNTGTAIPLPYARIDNSTIKFSMKSQNS